MSALPLRDRLPWSILICFLCIVAFPRIADYFWTTHVHGLGHLTSDLLSQAALHKTALSAAALRLAVGLACLLFTAPLALAWPSLAIAWWGMLGGPIPFLLRVVFGVSFPPILAPALGNNGFLFAIPGANAWGILTVWSVPLAGLAVNYWLRRSFRPANPYVTAWATDRQLRHLLIDPRQLHDAVLLAFRPKAWRFLGLRPTPSVRERGHALFVGPSRTGKSLQVIAQALLWDGSALINDIKGELYTSTAGHRQLAHGSRIYVLDPAGRGHRYDPFPDLWHLPGGIAEAAAILLQADEDRDPIFAQRGGEGLQAAVVAARRLSVPPFAYLHELLGLGLRGFVDTLARVPDPEVLRHLVLFIGHRPPLTAEQLNDRFLASAWSTLTTRVAPMLQSTVVAMLGGNDFQATDLVTRNTTLYLRFSESTLSSLKPVYRLILLAITARLIHHYDTSTEPVAPLLLLLDEAGRTAVPRLADLMATTSGRGMSLCVYVQSLSQLDDVYGRAAATTIRENARARIFYRPVDLETARYISECAGETLVPTTAVHRNGPGPQGDTTSRTQTQTSRPLIPPDKVRLIRDYDVIVFVAGTPPIMAQRIDPRESEALLAAMAASPPKVPRIPAAAVSLSESALQAPRLEPCLAPRAQ